MLTLYSAARAQKQKPNGYSDGKNHHPAFKKIITNMRKKIEPCLKRAWLFMYCKLL
jgi:hypothetical protein